jgi:uncharacterized repeat protein (TIGR02543 family)
MKKLFLGLVLFLTATLVLNYTKVEAGSIPTYDLTFEVRFGDGEPSTTGSVTGLDYGQVINIDTASWDDEAYDFLGFIVEGKVSQTIQEAQSFRMNETMDIVAYFKPVNTTAVIFMDSNHDFVDVKYTDGSGVLTEVPGYTELSKPGLTAVGWNVENIASHVFIEDTLVYLEYANASGTNTLTYDEGTGVATTTFDYNSLVTVTANGSGTFSHWLKDGKVASLDQTYKFTMVDDHTVEAIYDDASFVPDSDTLVTVSDIFEVEAGYDTIVGQFHLGANEEVVEWGIVESEIPGGITFDTPDVEIFKSTRYNETSNEFMMSFNQTATEIINYRGFITTINTLTDEVKTTYSYYQESMPVVSEYASDLIISEYGESGSYKYLEIYNGTGAIVDLSQYSLKLYANGATSPNNTMALEGSINDNTAQAITSGAILNFNGNDAIELVKDSTIIDELGEVGSSAVFGEDITLVRNASVIGPNSTYTSSEWTEVSMVSGALDDSNLGMHIMNLPTTEVNNVYTSSNTPSSVTITGDTSVNTNETIQLSADTEAVIWVSSDPEVITVDQTGLVTGVAEGTADVTAYSFYNHSVLDIITITELGLATYTVSFDSKGGSAVSSITGIAGGSTISEPEEPTKADNLFDGWYTSTDGGTTLDTEFDFTNTQITESITLYAKWIDISLAQYVDQIWDAGYSSDNLVYTDVELIAFVAATTDKGYILQDLMSAEMISIHDTVNTVAVGDMVYLAGQYNVSHEIARIVNVTLFRTLDSGLTLNYSVSNAVLIDFENYNQEDYIGKLVKVEQPFVDDTGTYIKLASNLDGLNNQNYDGNYVAIHAASAGTAVAELDGADNQQFLTKSVYIFFYDSTADYQKAIVIDSSHVVTETTYIVSFEENGGSLVDDQTIIDGNLANIPTEPTQTGFTFAGWYSDAGLTTSYNFSTPVTSAITLYAKWTAVTTHTVTFVDNGADATVPSQTINDGETAILPTEPTKTGYTFGGWYSDSGLTTLYDFDTAVTTDISIYAKWDEVGSVTYSTDLFISEVLDWDGGTNKAVELYNGTDSPITLDGTYTIKVNSNDNTTWGSSINLTGTIQPGETFVITNADEVSLVALSDLDTSISFNGDDAIGLFKNNELIDLFGVFGEDPGSGWTVGLGTTADSSIQRNPGVTEPAILWNTNEWSYFDDTSHTLGSHTVSPE